MSTMEAKRTIPQLRHRLLQIADDLYQDGLSAVAHELRTIAIETTRRYGGRKAKARFAKLTPEKAAEIRDMARRFPEASNQQLANWCKTNPGRVSEALTGKRNGEML